MDLDYDNISSDEDNWLEESQSKSERNGSGNDISTIESEEDKKSSLVENRDASLASLESPIAADHASNKCIIDETPLIVGIVCNTSNAVVTTSAQHEQAINKKGIGPVPSNAEEQDESRNHIAVAAMAGAIVAPLITGTEQNRRDSKIDNVSVDNKRENSKTHATETNIANSMALTCTQNYQTFSTEDACRAGIGSLSASEERYGFDSGIFMSSSSAFGRIDQNEFIENIFNTSSTVATTIPQDEEAINTKGTCRVISIGNSTNAVEQNAEGGSSGAIVPLVAVTTTSMKQIQLDSDINNFSVDKSRGHSKINAFQPETMRKQNDQTISSDGDCRATSVRNSTAADEDGSGHDISVTESAGAVESLLVADQKSTPNETPSSDNRNSVAEGIDLSSIVVTSTGIRSTQLDSNIVNLAVDKERGNSEDDATELNTAESVSSVGLKSTSNECINQNAPSISSESSVFMNFGVFSDTHTEEYVENVFNTCATNDRTIDNLSADNKRDDSENHATKPEAPLRSAIQVPLAENRLVSPGQLAVDANMLSEQENEDRSFEVEKIVGHTERNHNIFYQVKWMGYADKENQWIPSANFTNPVKMVEEYFLDQVRTAHAIGHFKNITKTASINVDLTSAARIIDFGVGPNDDILYLVEDTGRQFWTTGNSLDECRKIEAFFAEYINKMNKRRRLK